ncbi:hypothetical protein RHO47_25790, partial [Salmonella enterica subsp. enterica serovar Typhimurium]|nr:hypothetical protein [Salmonella enterica subsp. enterica serovar Typhimurium]
INMLWHTLLCCLLVGAATAYPFGWIPVHNRRTFRVQGRTLTALHQVSNKYTGVLIDAQLHLERPDVTIIRGKIITSKYAPINRDLSDGWAQEIPHSSLKWFDLPLRHEPFEVHLNYTSGEVESLIVNAKFEL